MYIKCGFTGQVQRSGSCHGTTSAECSGLYRLNHHPSMAACVDRIGVWEWMHHCPVSSCHRAVGAASRATFHRGPWVNQSSNTLTWAVGSDKQGSQGYPGPAPSSVTWQVSFTIWNSGCNEVYSRLGSWRLVQSQECCSAPKTRLQICWHILQCCWFFCGFLHQLLQVLLQLVIHLHTECHCKSCWCKEQEAKSYHFW
jgi:hypothetical protein